MKRKASFMVLAAALMSFCVCAFAADNNVFNEIIINAVTGRSADAVRSVVYSAVEDEYGLTSASSVLNAEHVILINFENPIPDGYVDSLELVDIGGGHKIKAEAAGAVERMLADARAEGLNPIIRSSYRTNAEQTYLFNRQVKTQKARGLNDADAFDAARRINAYPGTSEHEAGLALDIVSASYQSLDSRQARTPEGKWLMENCWKYGFILRYPEDKTHITNIIYEPWHYRYVGRDAAKEMYETGLCLEEYHDYLSRSRP